MKKSIKHIISFIIVISFIVGILIMQQVKTSNLPTSIVITQYRPGTLTEIKKINIDSGNDIKELSKYIRRIRIPKEGKRVQLALLNEIEIKYTDFIDVSIQLGETGFCYYTDKEKNISAAVMMPKGLYEWAKEKIE